MSTPAGWQRVALTGGVEFDIPAEARRGNGTQVDSIAGWFEGAGYRIAYDLGRFGERLDSLRDEQGFAARPRVVAGWRGTEVSFAPSDEAFGWARVIQLELGSDRTITLRVSCDTVERCALADRVFESIVVD